jgi:general nucleoside transport system ATP-binding protein
MGARPKNCDPTHFFSPNMPFQLELRDITKRYPAVLANDAVSLAVQPGEIHAVLGENGAGKSTLMKIVYGAVKPDSGDIFWQGARVAIRNPVDARALGISMVFQHFSLFDTLSVAENIWLGLDKAPSLSELTKKIAAKAREYGLDLDPLRPVHTLSVGERQRIEIVRALLTEPRLLILDEPTSVLTPQAVDKLFVTLRQISNQGCSILYISHKLNEIRALCTACTVLRGGKVVASVNPQGESNASLSRLMIGAEPQELLHRTVQRGAVALNLNSLNLQATSLFGMGLTGVSLALHSGEILGIAGVSGNGQQELMAAVSGEDTRAPAGSVGLFGADISAATPASRRAQGLHFVPEERLGRGAVPSMSLAQNTLLTRGAELAGRGGWLNPRRAAALAVHLIEQFKVKAGGAQAQAKSLSGGNLQKFIVGREIDARPKVLVISQPTWGVDVGAAAQIRGALLALRDAGCAVLVVSEELEELFEICDRLQVIAQGKLSPSLDIKDASVAQIGLWMSGLWETNAAAVSAASAAGEGAVEVVEVAHA